MNVLEAGDVDINEVTMFTNTVMTDYYVQLANLNMQCSNQYMATLNNIRKTFEPMLEMPELASQMCEVCYFSPFVSSKTTL